MTAIASGRTFVAPRTRTLYVESVAQSASLIVVEPNVSSTELLA